MNLFLRPFTFVLPPLPRPDILLKEENLREMNLKDVNVELKVSEVENENERIFAAPKN